MGKKGSELKVFLLDALIFKKYVNLYYMDNRGDVFCLRFQRKSADLPAEQQELLKDYDAFKNRRYMGIKAYSRAMRGFKRALKVSLYIETLNADKGIYRFRSPEEISGYKLQKKVVRSNVQDIPKMGSEIDSPYSIDSGYGESVSGNITDNSPSPPPNDSKGTLSEVKFFSKEHNYSVDTSLENVSGGTKLQESFSYTPISQSLSHENFEVTDVDNKFYYDEKAEDIKALETKNVSDHNLLKIVDNNMDWNEQYNDLLEIIDNDKDDWNERDIEDPDFKKSVNNLYQWLSNESSIATLIEKEELVTEAGTKDIPITSKVWKLSSIDHVGKMLVFVCDLMADSTPFFSQSSSKELYSQNSMPLVLMEVEMMKQFNEYNILKMHYIGNNNLVLYLEPKKSLA